MTVTWCPSWIVAHALTVLSGWYDRWERDKNNQNPRLRQLALFAKAYGIVAHDRYIGIPAEVAAMRKEAN